MSVAVIVPVFGNAATLVALERRVSAALDGQDWILRLVDDACPAGSGAVADALAATFGHVRVTHLPQNGGQHAAIFAGLEVEADATAWVVLDADLQDPPEAIPFLLETLHSENVAGVFAGRRGVYQSRVRSLTGTLHRLVLRALTGLPPDAGAYLVLDARLRAAVLSARAATNAPSIVAAVGMSRLRVQSVPVTRETRPEGRSAWTSTARLRQGCRTVGWAVRVRASGAVGTQVIPRRLSGGAQRAPKP